MKSPKIVSIGEVLWDLFPDGERFGGAPANVACHAAILGADVMMISAVGDDHYGRSAVEILDRYGVNTELMQFIEDARTGSVGVTVDEEGIPAFTIHEHSAWDKIAWNAAIESHIITADAVYFGTLGQRSATSRATIRQAVETAKSAGVVRVCDVNLRRPFFDAAMIRESIHLASVLKINDEELREVCFACGLTSQGTDESKLQQLRELEGLDLVVMTRGPQGVVLVTADQVLYQAAMPTVVCDTVGAGDSFTAAFLIGLLQRTGHAQNLIAACTVAAATCSHAGAVPPISIITKSKDLSI